MENYFIRNELYNDERSGHIFTHDKPIANKFVFNKFKKKIWLLQYSSLVSSLYKKYLPDLTWYNTLDVNNNILKSKTSVTLSNDEIRVASDYARTLGIPCGDMPIVLIFNRDSRYLVKHFKTNDSAFDYHNYRDFPISTMKTTIKKLVSLGYFVVRVGRFYSDKIDEKIDGYIDYTCTKPNDLLEVYLFSICRFVIGTPSGLYQMATLFRKPVVFTNFAPLLTLHYENSTKKDIFIPKIYYSKIENKILDASEIYQLNACTIFSKNEFEDKGIELHNNSPNEIENAAYEMHLRVNDKFNVTDEVKELQKKYFNLISPDLLNSVKNVFGPIYSDDHPIWEELDKNLFYQNAYPDVSSEYIKNHEWMWK